MEHDPRIYEIRFGAVEIISGAPHSWRFGILPQLTNEEIHQHLHPNELALYRIPYLIFGNNRSYPNSASYTEATKFTENYTLDPFVKYQAMAEIALSIGNILTSSLPDKLVTVDTASRRLLSVNGSLFTNQRNLALN